MDTGPTTPPVPPQPPTPETTHDSVSLPRKEYDELMGARRDLEAAAKERDTYKQRWSNTEKLLKADTNPDEQMQAVRSVMKDAGYSDTQIEAYLSRETQDDEEEPPSRKSRTVNSGEMAGMKRDMQGLASTLQAQIQERLQTKFDDTLGETLDQHEGLNTLIKARTRIEFGENADQAKVREFTRDLQREIASELARELREKLSIKRAQNQGGWKDEWIQEQAVEAAKAVNSRWRTFMGDPGRIGRVGETPMGTDRLSTKQPVPEPVYKKGMTVGDAQAQSRDWAIDHLLRGVHDSGSASLA